MSKYLNHIQFHWSAGLKTYFGAIADSDGWKDYVTDDEFYGMSHALCEIYS